MFDAPDFQRSLFFPRRHRSASPAGARDLRVEVAPDVRLHVRIHPAPAARVAVVLFHGNGEVVAEYDPMAASFAAAGGRLAVADYRGYGESDGEPTFRSALADASRVVERVALELAPVPVVVMGRSLGGACAVDVLRSAPVPLAGCVLESTFSDLAAFVRRRGLEPPVRFADEHMQAFDPLPKLVASSVPLLVIHGEADEVIAVSEAHATFAASGAADKALCLIARRGHNDVVADRRYWDALQTFFARLPHAAATTA